MEFMHNRSSIARWRRISARADRDLRRLQNRWPATTMAAIYTGLFLAGLWIFPLFPASPKLGPVYQNITHMVPLWFPVLLIAPAFALDLLRALDGQELGQLEIRARRRMRFHRGVCRRAMAVRRLPDLAGRAQSDLRRQLFRIFRPGQLCSTTRTISSWTRPPAHSPKEWRSRS